MAYPFVPSYHDYGPRGVDIKPLTIVVHMAEGGGTVGYLAKRNPNGVSVHYVVEYSGRVVQMLREDHINGSINPREIRTTDDPPYIYGGETVIYGASAARKCLGIWWDDPNRATIGIETEGFAKDGPNAAQAKALGSLVADIRTRQSGAPLLGHRDFADYKACPGKRIDWASLGGHGPQTGGDMSIQVPKSTTTDYRIRVKAGVDFFDDPDFTVRLGVFESDKELVYAGAPNGERIPARAVVHTTGAPYSDGNRYPTIVYVRDAEVSDPIRVDNPEPVPEPQAYDVIVGGKPVGSVTLP